MTSFSLAVDEFVRRAKAAPEIVVRKVATELLTGIVMKTPVGNPSLWKSKPPAGYVGGRAIGGPVSGGKIYEVNERGAPEMYEANGRQYLMAPKDGRVVPMAQGGGKGGVNMVVNYSVQGRIDRSTESQIAARAGTAANRALARNR